MFMTASHWSIDQVTDEMVAEAESKFLPMIMDTGADHAFMVQTGEDSMSHSFRTLLRVSQQLPKLVK